MIACGSLSAAATAEEPTDKRYSLDIPSSEIDAALVALARATGRSLIIPSEAVFEKRSKALKGSYTLPEALEALLQGTPLSGGLTKSGVIAISSRKTRDTSEEDEMKQNGLKRSLLASVSALLFGAGDAHAQDQTSDGADSLIEEVRITGSRIRQTSGMTTPTPVTVVTSVELSSMAPGSMVEAMSQLPLFFGNTTLNNPGSYFTAPSAGNLNMRGIGSNRTLVLMNGRRVVSASRIGTVDANFFPEAMIERVESVTGGASAAYGTDAVAGVVNFILDTDFTGVRGHLQGGITSRGDYENWEASASAGTPIGDRLHFLVSAETYHQKGVFTYEGRDWYQSWGRVTNTSSTGPRELVRPYVVSTQATLGGIITAPSSSALYRLHFLSDGTAVPFVLGDPGALPGAGSTASHSIVNGGSGTDNSADRPWLAPDADRDNAFLYLDYDLSDSVTLFAQGIVGNTRTERPNSGGRFTGSSYRFTIFRDNAFLPQGLRNIMVNENRQSFTYERFGAEADIAQNSFVEQKNLTYSGTFGFDADINRDGLFGGWRTNAYYQYGKTQARGRQKGGIRLDRIYAAVDAVVNPATGSIICRSAMVDPANYANCVPLNLFGAGNASAEAIDYVTGFDVGEHITSPLFFTDTGYDTGESIDYIASDAKVTRADITQHVIEFSADGEVWKGFGAGPVAMAVGASWRKESIHQIVEDVTNPSGDPAARPILGLPSVRGVPALAAARSNAIQFSTMPNIKGGLNVKEVFAEAIVPLLADVTAVQSLSATLAARWADYSGSGGIWAWKLGADWQVYNDLRFRGTLSRDVRAGTLSERYDMTGGLATIDDPTDGSRYDTSTRTGGNPNVGPERADTITIGTVFQPSWFEGFSVSLDWYKIKINGAIGQLGGQKIIDECFAGAVDLCAQIDRDANGRITQVRDVFLNIDALAAAGVDTELSYRKTMRVFGGGDEAVGLRLIGSWLDENSITLRGVPKEERAGQTGGSRSQLALPKYKVNVSVNYNNGPFGLFLQERYISSGTLDKELAEGVDIDDNSVAAAYYTDMRLSYALQNDGGAGWEVFFNVSNLFDYDPPVTAYFSSSTAMSTQYNPSLFDFLGRRFTVGAKFRY